MDGIHVVGVYAVSCKVPVIKVKCAVAPMNVQCTIVGRMSLAAVHVYNAYLFVMVAVAACLKQPAHLAPNSYRNNINILQSITIMQPLLQS